MCHYRQAFYQIRRNYLWEFFFSVGTASRWKHPAPRIRPPAERKEGDRVFKILLRGSGTFLRIDIFLWFWTARITHKNTHKCHTTPQQWRWQWWTTAEKRGHLLLHNRLTWISYNWGGGWGKKLWWNGAKERKRQQSHWCHFCFFCFLATM